MSEAQKLNNQLCFKYYVISKEIIRAYQPLLKPYNLTYTGYITLLALWEEDHQTINSLGQRLTLDSGTLTPLLKKLESLSFLMRKRSSQDERKVIVSLTREGKALKETLSYIPHALSETLTEDLAMDAGEVEHTLKALDTVYKLFRKRQEKR